VVGLGVQHPDSVLWTGTIMSGQDVEPLRQAGAVGDIGLCFINANGDPLKLELNDRLIGLRLDQIEHIPRVIGVAGGSAKYEVIRAALCGRLLDVLVTDHATARRLVADTEVGRV
jgi:DNA-binding transcriptional regulator LsrR (DeoR family)